MHVSNIPIDELKPFVKNPKKHPEKQIKFLQKSFKEFGWTSPILVAQDNMIVAGHGRWEAAKQAGFSEVPVIKLDMPYEKAVAYVIADNHLAELAETDAEQLAELLKEISEYEDFDIEATGFEMRDIDDMLNELHPKEIIEDAVPDVPEEPITQMWDVWELGRHRVMCGDSTSLENVLKLSNGDKVSLCFTSPPYWVGMEYEYQNTEQEIDEFIYNISRGICECVDVNCGRVVINTGTASINRIDKKRKVEILPLVDKWQRALKQHGWLLRHLRIWAKRGQLPASISPKTDVIDQHCEYIAEFENEFSQMITFWNQAGKQRGQERIGTPWAQQGVWDDVHGDKSAGGVHVAAFPVEIPSRIIKLYSKTKETVYEPFCGSGTTLIACEQLDRTCYGMELDPHYCDVIIQRYVNLTGNTELKRNGEPYTWQVKEK